MWLRNQKPQTVTPSRVIPPPEEFQGDRPWHIHIPFIFVNHIHDGLDYHGHMHTEDAIVWCPTTRRPEGGPPQVSR